ncbi:type VI secretion system protein TssA [Malikia sp.]|uniref:type VI secretion system protein TssA n=1 Tax=Malikia sp. TaxID=2070706 RepID=UPI00260D271E|nr:type VI secretion system protein TssA [Malikia sp.]MDD2730231.1 type VI secretion system protein TssA [Malikia sp.]
MSLEQWLAPVSAENPCGPNLEYDAQFLALEESVRIQPKQEFRREDGATIEVEGAEIQWPVVLEQAQSLLTRSKDLRVALLLTRALLHQEGYRGIALGLELIRRLLQEQWLGLHPGLDPDDGDPTMRLNALASLNALDAIAGDVRASRVLDSRQHGQLSVRDLEVAQGRLEVAPDEVKLTPAQVEGLLDAALSLSPDLAAQALSAVTDLDSIIAWLGEQVGAAQVPDLSRLHGMLLLVSQSLNRNLPSPQDHPAQDPESFAPDQASLGLSREAPVLPNIGQMHDRNDVVQALGILCEYLEKNEPTNPVQILLRRAQRMMNMSFLELMQDMAPEGLEQAEKVVGEKLVKDDE